ncbi:MAG TPA: DUF6431 domain-containing protein [Bacillota bacterium]
MTIKTYQALFASGLVDRDRRCEVCGQRRLRKHGSYERDAVRRPTWAVRILIQRYLCRACHKTCSLRPDLLWPRRSYVLPKIALSARHHGGSVRRIAAALHIPRSTLQHWLRHAERHLLPALRQWLAHELALRVLDVDVARLAARPESLGLLVELLRRHTARYDPALAGGARCRWRFLLRYLSRRGLLPVRPTTPIRPGKGTGPPRNDPGGGDRP